MIQNIYKIKASLMVIVDKLSPQKDLTPEIQKKFFQIVCLNYKSLNANNFSKFIERDEKKLLYEKCILFQQEPV